MKQTMLQLGEDMVKALDQRAAGRGISRSALVRQIIGAALANDEEALVSAQIVDGYRRIPPATPDEWGDLQTLNNAGTRELLHRLDAEERREGHTSW